MTPNSPQNLIVAQGPHQILKLKFKFIQLVFVNNKIDIEEIILKIMRPILFFSVKMHSNKVSAKNMLRVLKKLTD
jgi:hypothetical protein